VAKQLAIWGGTLLVALALSIVPTDTPAVEAQDEVGAAIHSAAVTYGVQEWRLRCLAQRESSFFPGAYNAAGYHGLYQYDWRTWTYGSALAGFAGHSPYEAWAAAHTTALLIKRGEGTRWPPLRYCGGFGAW
jgi:hypothetical protein